MNNKNNNEKEKENENENTKKVYCITEKNDYSDIRSTSNSNSQNTVNPNLFPTLSNTSKLLDDGTLSITAPSWISPSLKRIQLNNELEQHFEENRRAFLESIYNQGN